MKTEETERENKERISFRFEATACVRAVQEWGKNQRLKCFLDYGCQISRLADQPPCGFGQTADFAQQADMAQMTHFSSRLIYVFWLITLDCYDQKTNIWWSFSVWFGRIFLHMAVLVFSPWIKSERRPGEWGSMEYAYAVSKFLPDIVIERFVKRSCDSKIWIWIKWKDSECRLRKIQIKSSHKLAPRCTTLIIITVY